MKSEFQCCGRVIYVGVSCFSGEPVGVVAAEVTEESLFVDVNNLLDDLCDEGDYRFVYPM